MSEEQGAPQAGGDDSILPFQLDGLDMRGRIVRLDETLDRILNQHNYPPAVCALVGEAALLTALIGQAMKLRHKFSLQARGDGPVRLIATDYFAPKEEGAPAQIRAYAQFDQAAASSHEGAPHELLGGGVFGLLIDQGPKMQPYQGVTALSSKGLSASATTFFAQSEQVATRFHLAMGRAETPGGGAQWRAGGVMLQHLAPFGEGAERPGGGSAEDGSLTADDVAEMGDRTEEWRRASILLNTVEEMELIGPHVSPEELIWRLFHEETPRVFPAQSIGFGCTCGREKVAELLERYPEEAVREMAGEDDVIAADCQFCGAQYRFALSEFQEAQS